MMSIDNGDVNDSHGIPRGGGVTTIKVIIRVVVCHKFEFEVLHSHPTFRPWMSNQSCFLIVIYTLYCMHASTCYNPITLSTYILVSTFNNTSNSCSSTPLFARVTHWDGGEIICIDKTGIAHYVAVDIAVLRCVAIAMIIISSKLL